MMVSQTAAMRVFLAPGVTDMRKSFNGLYALVRGTFQADPTSGHLFVFCKRLEKGTFRWPQPGNGTVELTHAELNLLLGGLDLQDCRRRRWLRKAS